MGNSPYGWFLIGVGLLLVVVALLAGTPWLGRHPGFGWLQGASSPPDHHPGSDWLQEVGVIIGILAIVAGFFLGRAASR